MTTETLLSDIRTARAGTSISDAQLKALAQKPIARSASAPDGYAAALTRRAEKDKPAASSADEIDGYAAALRGKK